MEAAIPAGIDASLRQSLRSRLHYGNEVSFRKRLGALFQEHEAALEALAMSPGGWVARIVDYRNVFTHHPDDEKPYDVNHEELLQCIYMLRALLECCFLRVMGIEPEQIAIFAKRSYRYQQIRNRFFPEAE